MTKSELLILTDRCIAHLNDGGQPITLSMSEPTIEVRFGLTLNRDELNQLYKHLTRDTGLCRVYGDSPSGIGVTICLTDFGLSVLRDYGSYSAYLNKTLYHKLWRSVEGVIVVLTFGIVAYGAWIDGYFDGVVDVFRGEEQPQKEVSTTVNEELEEASAILLNTSKIDSIDPEPTSSTDTLLVLHAQDSVPSNTLTPYPDSTHSSEKE